MTGSRHLAYLSARTAIMAASLRTDRELAALEQLGLDELLKRLDLSPPGQLNTDQVNRWLERQLLQRLMDDLARLLRPAPPETRGLLIHWCRKIELYNLKALIRGKLLGLAYADIADNLHHLPQLIGLPHESLLRTESVAELLRRLEQGPYGEIARQARRVYEAKNEPFSLDATIDQRYYTRLLKLARKLPAGESPDLMTLLKGEIDRQNLQWILRYRFHYRLPPAQTYYLLIPFGQKLGRDRLHRLVNCSDLAQVLELLPPGFDLQDTESLPTACSRLAGSGHAAWQKALRYSQSTACRALAYLVLREQELKRLFALLQGRLLELPQPWIEDALNLEVAHA